MEAESDPHSNDLYQANLLDNFGVRSLRSRECGLYEAADILLGDHMMMFMRPHDDAMHDVHDMDYDTIGLSERIDMLNEDQRRIFDQVADHLKHQSRHDCDDCKCRDLKPLHMFVSGVGGTGKSFLIETIRSLVKEIWKDNASDDTTCAVAAPTGTCSLQCRWSNSTSSFPVTNRT